MFGIIIMIFLIFSSTSFSSAESASILSAFSATFCLRTAASSFFPCAISAPISFEILFFSALNASTSCLISRFFLSSSKTSSTKGSFSSWNLFLIFCFTASGLFLTNLISNIVSFPLFLSIFYLNHMLPGI